jgi:hypothetical protein
LLSAYLPASLSAEELAAAVAKAIAETAASGPADMGKVMACLRTGLAGRVDMSEASRLVKIATDWRPEHLRHSARLLAPRGSMIPDSFIQEMLYRVDLVDLIDGYVPLKKTGANFAACCPFHSEKSPVLYGQSEQAVLPLLWLRRARQRHRLSHGVLRSRLCRRGQGTGWPCRHAGSRRTEPPGSTSRSRRRWRDHGARGPFYYEQLKGSEGGQLPQGARA